jgi:hypothetical protein
MTGMRDKSKIGVRNQRLTPNKDCRRIKITSKVLSRSYGKYNFLDNNGVISVNIAVKAANS